MGRHLWKYSNNQEREQGWGAQGGAGPIHVRVMVYRHRYPMSGTRWTLQPTISVDYEMSAALGMAADLGTVGLDWTLSGDAVKESATPAQLRVVTTLRAGQGSTNLTEDQRAAAAELRAR